MVETDFDILASRAIEPTFYHAPFPDTGNVKPRMFQHAAVEYALPRNNSLIGDAPGVGKSAEGVLLGNAIEARSTLVCCPASLRLNWEREIWTWSTLENVSTYPILKAKDGVSLKSDYVIVSYDMLRNENIMGALLDRMWDHLILDEAHFIKDPRGNKRTIPICAPDMLPSVAGRITALSGTIMPNQPIECYNIMRLLDWDALDRMSLEDFREYYYGLGGGWVTAFNRMTRKYEPKYSGKVRNQPRNLDDLQYRLRKNIMVRRLKEQVLHELPKKQWHVFPIETTAAVRSALKHPGWGIAEKLFDLDPNAFDTSLPIDGAISTARKLLGEAMAPIVASYIHDLMDSGIEKLLVAGWHHTVLDYLREELAEHGLVYMDGRMSTSKKQGVVDLFQTDPKVKIILGQMIPLGVGWTLTKAQDAVFAEFDFVPGNNDQFLDRLHRIGQVGGYVLGHVPVVPESLGEKIIGRAVEKSHHIHAALDA